MQTDPRSYKDFLAAQDPDELARNHSHFPRLIENLGKHLTLDTPKRPHIAMPEQRGLGRYQVGLDGACWGALAPEPADEGKTAVAVLDISSGGCRIMCDTTFSPLSLIALELHTSGWGGRSALLEVVRSQACRVPGKQSFEIGCRIVDAKVVLDARNEQQHIDKVRRQFQPGGDARVLHLAAGAGSQLALRALDTRGIETIRITSAKDILPALHREKAENSTAPPPDALICPASMVARKTPPVWLKNLAVEFPTVGILALAATEAERSRVRRPLLVDRVCLVKRVQQEMLPTLELLVAARSFPVDSSQRGLKILLAAHEKKRIRQVQTLLWGKDYHLDHARSYTRALRRIQSQVFDILLLSAGLLSENPADDISELRANYPALTIVIEATDEKSVEAPPPTGADLVLGPMPNRKQFIECLKSAALLCRRRHFSAWATL
jgi:CheY-like chemotaxis protein